MPKIRRRPEALSDAADIWAYIAMHDIDAADRLLQRLDRKFSALADMPMVGRSRDELAAGVRSVAIGTYLIFYRPLPDGIDVLRILHGARDIKTVFRP